MVYLSKAMRDGLANKTWVETERLSFLKVKLDAKVKIIILPELIAN